MSVTARPDLHHCHARGCDKPCRPEHLCCARHWRMVPFDLQAKVYAAYRPGQCNGNPLPSKEWHVAAERALNAIAKAEGKPIRKTLSWPYYEGEELKFEKIDLLASGARG